VRHFFGQQNFTLQTDCHDQCEALGEQCRQNWLDMDFQDEDAYCLYLCDSKRECSQCIEVGVAKMGGEFWLLMLDHA